MKKMQKANCSISGLYNVRRKLLALVTLCFFMGSTLLYAQEEKRVTLQVKNATMEEVLSTIKEQTGLKFVYSDEDMQSVGSITLSVKNVTVKEAIDRCLKGTALTASVRDNTIVISAVVSKGGKVTGKVLDAENLPMVGVNVTVMKGQQMLTGVTTDLDGNFEIEVPRGTQLRFTFVGYKELLMNPSLGRPMAVRMEEDTSAMEEVVVNGFFTRSKQTFTGAAKTYTGEQVLSISPTNLFQALSTLDPAMTITQNNAMGSNPNAIPELVIRSTTSLSTNSSETGLNTPLIVIDGVERSLTDLYDIDMQDIERIDILKDASATALYGENAANGVIIIERKRVSQSPVRIRYTFTPEISFADLSSYDLCNAAQKLELERMAGLYTTTDGSLDQSYYDKLAKVNSGIDTDWISKPVRNSFSHSHSLSISGRGSGLDYNITGNFSNTAGVMKDDARDRYGLNVYLSYRAVDKLILTLRASHEQVSVKNSKYGDFSSYLEANPYESPYDEEGNWKSSFSFGENNPLYEASLSSFNKSDARKQTISLDARYNFKPNLYVTAQASYLTSRETTDVFVSPASNAFASVTSLDQKGSYQLGNLGTDEWSAKIVGNWIHSFDNEGTMFTLNVGGEAKHSDAYKRCLTATGFLSDNLSDVAYAVGYTNAAAPGGSEDLAASVGAFAAANFIYKNKYVVDGSYRMSGSSKFGADNQYAPFWSVGLGYNLHNEEFIKKLGWVNTLRLRGSYGYTGSVKFDAYQAVSTYYYSSSYLHYTGVGAIPHTMANPDLTWQTTKKLNVGITSSLFNDRLNVNFDYYNEVTDDMLIDISLPPSSGVTTVKSNYGSQESNGVEFSLWGKIIDSRDWEWNLSVNGLHSKTTIKNISEALKRQNEENASKNETAAPLLQYREGESPTAIYAVRSAGIDPASGQEIYIKKDGTYTYSYNVEDMMNVGDTNPWMQGSLSSYLSYKQFALNVNFSYRFGGDLYNSTRMAKIENVNPQRNVDIRAFTERWHQAGDVVPYLDISATGGKAYIYSDRFVEKDNELWLSNVNLQYNVPDECVKKFGLQKLYVGVGMEDLFRLTTAKYERGTSYPYSRSVNFSLSVTF